MVLDVCFSSSGVVLSVVEGLRDLTGDYFSAILLIVILLIVLCLALQMPLEVSALFVLPFLLVCYACVPQFTAITFVFLVYVGIIVAKNFIIK